VARDGGLTLRLGDGLPSLALPDGAPDLASRVGRRLIVGFRPEALSVRRGEEGRAGETAPSDLPLTVDVVEPLGNEIFLYAHAGAVRVTARVPPQPLPEPGRPITLAIDVARLHFFDADTEKALVADRAA
jgi:multiple sugar transport system ATP-binding protein